MSSNAGLDAVIVEAQIINPEFLIKIDDIIKRIIANGSLLISGTGGSGKTFASMWLIRRIMQNAKFESNEYKISIVEPCLNYRFKFDEVPYIEYATTNVIPKQRAIIVDMNGMKPKAKRDGLSSILTTDFVLKQKLKIENNGINTYKNFYMLDELHNIIGRYALVGDKGADLLDVITECRNFDMYLIGVTRRLADISTQFVESSRNFLFGKTSGENDIKKIDKMFGNKVSKAVSNLKPRSFIFFDTEDNSICEIGFPDFRAIGKPFEVKENTSQGYVKQW
jgi:hypothetical protein